ncbi:hypothetical protein LWI29_011526 [Acer saccharum]|uniref:Uncharacterized protein n=1 Tax=Acer saccharum TaxID=4024 RepID=A0AA39RUA9_ACESA|nr:hypothetical protein LWI29_011526 [Acer saccharum]
MAIRVPGIMQAKQILRQSKLFANQATASSASSTSSSTTTRLVLKPKELASLVLDDDKHSQDRVVEKPWKRTRRWEVSWENGRLGLRVDADDVGFDRLID